MTTKSNGLRLALAGVGLFFGLAGVASATNGYFSHGYGTKAKGRGGAAIGLADDAITAANNPAGFAQLGDRFDAGFEAFVPKRGGSRQNDFEFNERSDRDLFIIPDFGVSKSLTRELAIGVTLYGNGGLNTDYQMGDSTQCVTSIPSGRGNPFCGQGPAGVNLEQLVVAPSVAYQVTKNHAVGVSLLMTYQRFYAQGLQLFGDFGFSREPDKLTNNGTSSSRGTGYRLGYLGTFGPVKVGLAYAPKIDMTEFKEYAGLFANQGDFDIPENYGVGISWQVTKKFLMALDVTEVKYTGVPSVGNTSTTAGAFCANALVSMGNCLGDSNGPGFGWDDVKTYKLGMEWAPTNKLTLRIGYNKGNNPVSSENVSFNILAPGVVEDHYTAGMTYKLSDWGEFSAHYMRAPGVTVTGPSAFSAFSIQSPVDSTDMDQQSVSMSFGVKY